VKVWRNVARYGVLLEVSTTATCQVLHRAAIQPFQSPSPSPSKVRRLCFMSDRASKALAEASLPGEPRTYDARSKRSGVPLTTLYYRNHGRCSKEEKAQGQQYLTPSEEKALEKYLKLMADLGNPMRIKYLPSLAFSITRRRSTTNKATKPPNKNWAQAF
jgi:hypothetical protein